MAEGLVSAAKKIAGAPAEALIALSNDGKSPVELRAELDSLAGNNRAVVFVDLQSGSCGMAALSCCKDSVRRVVICGVNLPMILDFVFHSEEPLPDIVARAVEKGQAAIAPVGS
jgi:mannose/fructose-specific phosphotransferase system component IIA|tara:strand:- start:77 stop:418 length:342 start_codon:yes stop_codon:yes gene_type:complete